MGTLAAQEVTQLLIAWSGGDRTALDRLLPMVEQELHRLARRYMSREAPNHTLQTTALVNEAYLRLVDQERVAWQGRAHFMAIAASMMRRVLMDHGRRQKAGKRGGGSISRVTFDERLVPSGARELDLVALDEALDALAALDELKARIVELRAFGGLEVEETAEVLGISTATVKRHWAFALAWLQQRVRGEPPPS